MAILTFDAKRQGLARRCRPGPHVHFGPFLILRVFREFFGLFLPLRAQFSSELPEILHEVS